MDEISINKLSDDLLNELKDNLDFTIHSFSEKNELFIFKNHIIGNYLILTKS